MCRLTPYSAVNLLCRAPWTRFTMSWSKRPRCNAWRWSEAPLAVLKRTVEYVSERQQHGRAIGSYQAVQHLLANVAIQLNGARVAALRGAVPHEQRSIRGARSSNCQDRSRRAVADATTTAHTRSGVPWVMRASQGSISGRSERRSPMRGSARARVTCADWLTRCGCKKALRARQTLRRTGTRAGYAWISTGLMEQRAFRQTVRDFLATHLPEELTASLQEGEAVRDETWDENVRGFDRGMVERGWQVFGLPEEYGGKPLTAMNRLIVLSEVDYANAPRYMRGHRRWGRSDSGRVGTEENKRMWLDKLVSGDGHRLDRILGTLSRKRSRRLAHACRPDGDHWVINGQKAWNSRGHIVSHVWPLARTGARPKAVTRVCRCSSWFRYNAPGVEVQKVELGRSPAQRCLLRRRTHTAQSPDRRGRPGLVDRHGRSAWRALSSSVSPTRCGTFSMTSSSTAELATFEGETLVSRPEVRPWPSTIRNGDRAGPPHESRHRQPHRRR